MTQTPKHRRVAKRPADEIPGGMLSELERLNRILRTLSAGNRLLLRSNEEQQLLQGMCDVVVTQGGYRYASVWYASHDEGRSLVNQAYALGLPHAPDESAFFESLRLSWASPEQGGATAVAVLTGTPCIGRNLLSDPDHRAWKEDAMRLSYGSLTAFPICVDSAVIGALSIAASEPDAFDASEVALLGELAEDLAYGIGNLRIRAKKREAEAIIHHMAFYDALTQLPNRQFFYKKAQALIDESKGVLQSFALLIIKVRQFHEINETFGFPQGDKILMEIKQRLRETFGSYAEVFRVGDAEFALLLPNADVESATHISHRVVSLFQTHGEKTGLNQYTRLTVGIAVYPGHGLEPDLLIRHARSAMSEARRTGRDHAVFSNRLDEGCSRRLELTAELRDAISSGDLMLYCQPKVSSDNSTLCGAEALVRWRSRAGEMVSPSEFVPLAEFSGLITPLTHWVLETAFRQRFAWHELGINIPLAVNLSAQDLYDPRLVGKVEGLMATWGSLANWIQFEVTESGLMQEPSVALETIKKIKSMGIKFAIDDFGVGYSSLSYLSNLPVDSIKIDQSFVRAMLIEPEAAAIVGSTIDLAHQLNFEVVAEGVESEEIRDRLEKMGCDVIQGYFISAPMPIEEFGKWVGDSGWWGSGNRY